MDFGFTPEQDMLRETARRFLETECAPATVRAAIASPTAHDPALWRQLAELGWLGVLVPEAYGGLGGSFLDLTVILEETGKVLLPGPFFATAVLGTTALLAAGSAAQRERLLPAIARGDLVVALAAGPAADATAREPAMLTARPHHDGWVLAGAERFVLDAHVADRLVVAARPADGSPDDTTLFLIDPRAGGVEILPLRTADMTRRWCTLRCADVPIAAADVLGSPGGGAAALRRTLAHAESGLATELVGVAQRALDMSVAYANTRTQFGRPIGSFQAIKHKCVDMMVAVENARSLAYYAAWTVSEDAPEAHQAVAMAKAYASDMGKTVTSEAIQVHGGIGFTWEHDLHLYYRRALAAEASFGTAAVHRERIADTILADAPVR
jgi:alkylation response protein AidB-like acyl-CoA dehydrogenase